MAGARALHQSPRGYVPRMDCRTQRPPPSRRPSQREDGGRLPTARPIVQAASGPNHAVRRRIRRSRPRARAMTTFHPLSRELYMRADAVAPRITLEPASPRSRSPKTRIPRPNERPARLHSGPRPRPPCRVHVATVCIARPLGGDRAGGGTVDHRYRQVLRDRGHPRPVLDGDRTGSIPLGVSRPDVVACLALELCRKLCGSQAWPRSAVG